MLALFVSEADAVPNGSFEEGRDAPEGWSLEGIGAWEKSDVNRWVSVEGTGDDTTYWRTTDYAFAPNTVYRMRFRAAADRATGGCVIAGPSFCNRDFRTGSGWQEKSFVFVSPDADQVADGYMRLGQWHAAGQVSFDDVRLSVTQPVHRRARGVELGEGERLEGATYAFVAPFGSEGTNYSRPLHSFRAGFNSTRWVFDSGSEVIYVHRIPGAVQQSATVEANCNYHLAGIGLVEASGDGKRWVELARFDGVTSIRADVPPELLPANTVYVRLRAADGAEPAGFQINHYGYTATLYADMGELVGGTVYPDIQRATGDLRVTVVSGPGPAGQAEDACGLRIENLRGVARDLRARAVLTTETGVASTFESRVSLAPAGEAAVVVPCVLRRAGENTLTLELLEDGESVFRAVMKQHVAGLYDASYGYALPSAEPVELWWCEGTYKVSRARAVPLAPRAAIELEAARNEYEPVQLVLRPESDLTDVRVSVSDLSGPGAVLSAANIAIAQVAYVKVTRPTDSAGARGWWPDPIPAYEQGQTLKAGVNHPLWITVYVPEEQPAGRYAGTIKITADGWETLVPVKLTVWDFALPRASHLQTAFGLSPGSIRRYHNLDTTEELRQVLDLYHRDFAAHRVAPYSPAPLDSIRVEFPAAAWEGGAYDTERPHSGKRCLKVVDESATSSILAHNADLAPVDPAASYRVSWWVRTLEPEQPYLVTLQQYDGDGQWISGNNIDIPRTGSGRWEQEEVVVPPLGGRLNELTRALRVCLRPAPWSEAGEATGAAWFDDVRFCRADDGRNLLRSPGFELEAAELTAKVDFTAFDRECEKYLDGLGFSSIMIRLRGMPGGTFHARRAGQVGPFAQGTPEYEKLMASQGRQIVEHLRAKGWLDKAYVYWFDEPDPKDYDFVIEGMELIRRAAPGLTRMLTEQPEPALAGHVDLWCPVVSAVTPEAILERKEHGERFWWYLCTGPKAPYIGLFIDRPATDLRVWAWLSRKWGVEGQLVWSSNYWTSGAAFPSPDIQNPWEDPMGYVSGYSFEPGRIGYWGNGDGRFLYPPNRDVKNDRRKYLCGPVDSVRWEMLREGIEDYEYFRLLDDLIAAAEREGMAGELLVRAKALAVVPDAVIADDKTYSKDPQPLYAHRRLVAEMIERLSRALE